METSPRPTRRTDTAAFFTPLDFDVPATSGTPALDLSPVAELVDATELKAGDFVGNGAAAFHLVTRDARPFRGKTRVETSDRARTFRAGAQVWRLR